MSFITKQELENFKSFCKAKKIKETFENLRALLRSELQK